MFLFYPETNNFNNSETVGRRNLRDPSMNNFLMLYRLVYSILSHLTDLISAWSALLQ